MPRRIKPASGQIDLLGQVFDLKLGFPGPRIVEAPNGAAVVVCRIPEGTDPLIRQKALDESSRLARTIKTTVRGYNRRPTITEEDYEV